MPTNAQPDLTPRRKGAEAAESSPMPPQPRQIFWIDVRDHLPDDELTVLGYLGNGHIELAFHADGRWYQEGALADEVNIFFWADLPELPNFCSEHEKAGAQ